MSKGLVGLVAYGDSDSDSSDSESPSLVPASDPVMAPSVVESNEGVQGVLQKASHVNTDSDAERTIPQDTTSSLSSSSKLIAPPLKAIPTQLQRHGYKYDKEHSAVPALPDVNLQDREHGITEFSRSQSGTPLPPDHSAVADVMNTPTAGISSRVAPPDHAPTANIDYEAVRDDSFGFPKHNIGGGYPLDNRHDGQASHTAMMQMLLRPRPIAGVVNFGIPPSPEGLVNPDVQVKMERFQEVKETRGIHFNQSMMKNKNFRNPHIYSSLVELVSLNETGSNFEKSIEFFDFGAYGPESYSAGLVEAQKQASERLAMHQQAGARSQLQFISGSVSSSILHPSTTPTAAPGSAAPVGGITAGIGGTQSLSSVSVTLPQGPAQSAEPGVGMHSSTVVSAGTGTGSQRSRKSKWDVSQPSVDDHSHKRPRH